jgi:hypothetical protein
VNTHADTAGGGGPASAPEVRILAPVGVAPDLLWVAAFSDWRVHPLA